MKRETRQIRGRIVNDVLYYCYAHIDAPIQLHDLAELFTLSPFHLHRIFKEETGLTLQESIRSIRLQKASSLLLTNTAATVSEVAQSCGYASHTSFIKAFKKKYDSAPLPWRKGAYRTYVESNLSHSDYAHRSKAVFHHMQPKIVKQRPIRVAYLRHKGYNKSIAQCWEKLLVWAYEEGLDESCRQMGLHHDNPLITPLHQCNYVACLELPENVSANRSVGELIIPGGLYASFFIEGAYGDVLKLLEYVYLDWLPKSGYETKALPAYAQYYKNHFVSSDGNFELALNIPIRLG